jgi:hypothetical protein
LAPRGRASDSSAFSWVSDTSLHPPKKRFIVRIEAPR